MNPSIRLTSPVSVLYGVGPRQTERLLKLDIKTIQDLLLTFPRRYEDYSQTTPIKAALPGQKQSVRGAIWQVSESRTRRGQSLLSATIVDGTGTLKLTWFNQPYLKQQLVSGADLIASGKIELYRGTLTIANPAFEVLSAGGGGERESVDVGRIVPIYPETAGITSRWIRRKVQVALELVGEQIFESLPEALLREADLMPLRAAYQEVHFPSSQGALKVARRRFGFEELFFWQLHAEQRRSLWRTVVKPFPQTLQKQALSDLRARLPFTLTRAQQHVIRDILADLEKPYPMARLVEGDVGSGKTVVAAFALQNTVASGFQAALMAPTEVLAEQHFVSLQKLFPAPHMTLALLTGSKALLRPGTEFAPPLGLREADSDLYRLTKTELQGLLKSGAVDVVVGTHALIVEGIGFAALGLVVIDEQHRFGVAQRAELAAAHGAPDILIMTATPIPRTLALALFGELDISIMDEMPAGRKRIKTKLVPKHKQMAAYDFVRQELESGGQAFVVCPLIDPSETVESESVQEVYTKLSTAYFPSYRVGMLHGKLPTAEKGRILQDFRDHHLDILVSTSVIEVGVDIPRATVMLIEGADRFGLSQLHQFRGRVGRGDRQAYCFLFTESDQPETLERLEVFARTDDGFALAEADLRLRGPGEVFGGRQSGAPDLKMASLLDAVLLAEAQKMAQIWLPRLPEYPQLTRRLESLDLHHVVWH